ncbi:hypothetical protein TNCV_3816691 [Trichonephila clavipes]|nr:hypothetical protein TNCV_3816691 [Trichonephila clavipes]
MTSILQECALLVKLFYKNEDSTTEALRKFRFLKWLRKGPLSSQELTHMTRKFEATSASMHRQHGQRYSSLLQQSVIPAFQTRQCDTTTVFMQDDAPPYITHCVK